jgi:hypothetical protein
MTKRKKGWFERLGQAFSVGFSEPMPEPVMPQPEGPAKAPAPRRGRRRDTAVMEQVMNALVTQAVDGVADGASVRALRVLLGGTYARPQVLSALEGLEKSGYIHRGAFDRKRGGTITVLKPFSAPSEAA